jgi:hypothetical protein
MREAVPIHQETMNAPIASGRRALEKDIVKVESIDSAQSG